MVDMYDLLQEAKARGRSASISEEDKRYIEKCIVYKNCDNRTRYTAVIIAGELGWRYLEDELVSIIRYDGDSEARIAALKVIVRKWNINKYYDEIRDMLSYDISIEMENEIIDLLFDMKKNSNDKKFIKYMYDMADDSSERNRIIFRGIMKVLGYRNAEIFRLARRLGSDSKAEIKKLVSSHGIEVE